jgi:fatty acid desaturase
VTTEFHDNFPLEELRRGLEEPASTDLRPKGFALDRGNLKGYRLPEKFGIANIASQASVTLGMEPALSRSESALVTSDPLVRSAFELTRHLAVPRPLYYWLDCFGSELIGWVALFLAGTLAVPWNLVFFGLAVVAFYRAIIFIHELVHLKGQGMGLFMVGWNAFLGVPLLTPSFLYDTHLQHHARNLYGTIDDGEYLPWGIQPPHHMLLFPLISVMAPPLMVLRFLVLAPLGWLVPPLHRWLYERASALTIRFGYRRNESGRQQSPWWRVQEVGASLWALFVTALVVSGKLSLRWVVLTLSAIAAVSFLNAIRALSSHRYRNDEHSLTFVEQVRDSVNHPDSILAEIWAPTGLRYHALHHLLPSLPYHALPEAHRILMKRLPADSFYRETNSPNLRSTLKTLWTGARNRRAVKPSHIMHDIVDAPPNAR